MWPLTKSSTARSTFGRSGSIRSNTKARCAIPRNGASASSNATQYYASQPIVERQKSVESSALPRFGWISVVRWGGGGIVFDEGAAGNHRRGRAAQPAAAAHKARIDARPRRRRVGTGRLGQRQRRAYVATFRFGKVQPLSPSPRRAATSRSSRHSA